MLYMIYQQNCFNINIEYYDKLIKVNIGKINNNVEKFKIYENVLDIFKLNKVDLIIKYFDKEYLVFSEEDLLRVFKNFINV